MNGKRNGKGKEYKTNQLIYEGEYLNGKRNGKGKEYDYNKELIFEGEYLNDKRWNGKGKEYDYNNEIIFEGEYENGKRLKVKIKESNDLTQKIILKREKIGKGNHIIAGTILEGEDLNGKSLYKCCIIF